jgi:endonuclease/exonuclease/phosphatase family metal-dependent hydrolase
MNRKKSIFLFLFIILVIVLLAIAIFFLFNTHNSFSKTFSKQKNAENILFIANWNLQIFGDKKAENSTLMELYAGTISKYDIIFLQELRDADNNSFKTLCNMLPEYNCLISSRAGRSSSKEQYGVIYLDRFNVSLIDYNPDVQDRWERPPIKVILTFKNYSVSIYNTHIKPNETTKELKNLETMIMEEKTSSENIIILGDLNADCDYMPEPVFKDWKWIIKDNDDTTATGSNCAYDRIIMNANAYREYYSYGIYKNTSKEASDHYLIWVAVIADNLE